MRTDNLHPPHGFMTMLRLAKENGLNNTPDFVNLMQAYVVPVPPVMTEAERQQCRILEEHAPALAHVAAAALCGNWPSPILQTWSAARYPQVHHTVRPWSPT